MGMYTQFHFASELRRDTPANVLAILEFMVGVESDRPEPLPDHDFFATPRWRFLFTTDSYYFDADTHSTLRFDDISDSWVLNVQSNLKNYDNEIELFLDWIDPYLDKYEGDFLGYSRYEEDEQPTILFKLAARSAATEGRT